VIIINIYKDYEYYGVHKISYTMWIFRVFAPAAKKVELIGDFNKWNPAAMELNNEGVWEIKHAATSG
jgi:1,4-alpha-glucan branching enzyme